MPRRDEIAGLVLAGGRGERFGGADKGLIEHAGQPLALHVLRRLAPQVSRVLISANRNGEVYRRWAEVIGDAEGQAYAGPLAGIGAALLTIDTPWLAVAPCDLPQLPLDAVARLSAGLGAGRAAFASSSGRHSLLCLLHADASTAVTQLLAGGEHRVARLFEAMQAQSVAFTDDELANVNTPAALASLANPQ